MVDALRCSQCSAPVQDDRWTTCPYCGTLLDKPTIDPLRAVVAHERFAAAERAPGYEALIRHAPSVADELFGLGFLGLFQLLWIVAAGTMTFYALPSGAAALVPGAMCVIGVVWLVGSVSRAVRFSNAKLERRLLVWRDERTEVSGGGKHSSATTEHFVLLEGRDGQRLELECDGDVAGKHAAGDIGVAYLRDGVLLDFRRIDA
jgi:hypothetical protein